MFCLTNHVYNRNYPMKKVTKVYQSQFDRFDTYLKCLEKTCTVEIKFEKMDVKSVNFCPSFLLTRQ